MYTVDFHSHTLPAFDDGAKNVEESLALLKMLSDQGIKTVCATPHFNANRLSVNDFLTSRSAAFANLRNSLPEDAPTVRLGAEVAYYEGISRLDNLSSLCIEGTNLLLLEMPFCKWSESMINEVIRMSCRGDFRIVLAHIERYMVYNSIRVYDRFLENDITMQVNASFFTELKTRSKAFKMLKKGYIHLIGSDCHNVADRPPFIGNALYLIEKKMGTDYLSDMAHYWNSLFSKIYVH